MADARYSRADRELERRLDDLAARVGEVVVESADDLDLDGPDLWTQQLLYLRIGELEDKIEGLKAVLNDAGDVLVRTVDILHRIDPDAHRALVESLRREG